MSTPGRPVVMKFGGTSVADANAVERVIQITRASVARGVATVVVVSAISGVPDRLLALATAADQRDRKAVREGVDQRLARHPRVRSAELQLRARRPRSTVARS